MRKIFILFILVACSSQIGYAGLFKKKSKKPHLEYGIEKSHFDAMTEGQKQGVMTLYEANQKQVAVIEGLHEKIAALEKEVKETEKLTTKYEKLQAKFEAQEKALNAYLSVSEDLLAARMKKKNYEEREKREKFHPKIATIHRGFNATTIELDNNTLLEVSPFEKEKIDAWMNGQTVELTKGDGLVYTLYLTNLDTENSVSAKIKEKPAP